MAKVTTANSVSEEFAIRSEISPQMYNAARVLAGLIEMYKETANVNDLVPVVSETLADGALVIDILLLAASMLATYETALSAI